MRTHLWPHLQLGLALLLASALRAAPTTPTLDLTVEEKNWLAAHPTIRVGYDPTWPPFSFTDAQGRLDGMDRDTLRLLEPMLGIKFEPVALPTWPAVLQAAEKRQLDLLCSTGDTPDRRRYLTFTKPYLFLPHVFVARDKIDTLLTASDLQDKIVALPRDYAITENFLGYYPDAHTLLLPTEADCFAAINEGKADFTVAQLASATFTLRTARHWDLHFVGVHPDSTAFNYGVRSDWPELVTILNKAVAALRIEDRQAIYNQWVNPNLPQPFPWRKVLQYTLLAALLVLLLKIFLLYRHRLLNRELHLRHELIEKIEAQRTQLAAISAAKSSLLRTLAHDLRTPLTGLSLNLSLSEIDSTPHPLDPEIRGLISYMALLLDNLLTAQAIEDGVAHYPLTTLNPATLTKSIVANHQRLAAQKNLRLHLDTSSSPATHLLNETAWNQILQNLLSNALKFSRPDGDIKLRLFSQENHLVFTIQDNGPGLSETDFNRLFQLYGRGTASPTGGEKSHGIGLAVVRELVTQLHGTITCENASPGALFRLKFPAASS